MYPCQKANTPASEKHPVAQHVPALLQLQWHHNDMCLNIAKNLTKFGPILGLMGTLIPMGPALVGLSTGDVASMAYNMQVAFATTVIGLFSGGIGYILLQVKQRWIDRDLLNLDFLAGLAGRLEEQAGKEEIR